MEGRGLCDPAHVRSLTRTHRGGQWKAGPGARVGDGRFWAGGTGVGHAGRARLASAVNVAPEVCSTTLRP